MAGFHPIPEVSGRLYTMLRTVAPRSYGAKVEVEAFAHTGLMSIETGVARSDAPDVVRDLLGELSNLATYGPTRAEMERARRCLALDHALGDEEDAAASTAEALLYDLPASAAERIARLMAVTSEDVRDAARVVFDPARMALIAEGGDKKRLRAALNTWAASRVRR